MKTVAFTLLGMMVGSIATFIAITEQQKDPVAFCEAQSSVILADLQMIANKGPIEHQRTHVYEQANTWGKIDMELNAIKASMELAKQNAEEVKKRREQGIWIH